MRCRAAGAASRGVAQEGYDFLSTFTCDAAGTNCLVSCVGIEGKSLELQYLAGEIVSLTGKPFYMPTSTNDKVLVLQD